MDDKSRDKVMKTAVAVFSVVFTAILLIFIFTIISRTTKFDYTANDNGIVITQGKGIEILYKDIKGIEYLEKMPSLSRRNGTDFKNIRAGIFDVKEIGRGYVFAKDITRPAIMLRTEQTFYIITPENPQSFKQEVEKKISQK